MPMNLSKKQSIWPQLLIQHVWIGELGPRSLHVLTIALKTRISHSPHERNLNISNRARCLSTHTSLNSDLFSLMQDLALLPHPPTLLSSPPMPLLMLRRFAF